MIKEQPTWQVQDPTKLQAYMVCARAYFYEYVLGWRLDEPNIHLEFGSALHLAMEHILLNGFSAESLTEAYILFEKYYRDFFSPEMDAIYAPKTPANVMRALPQYAQQYAILDKDFDVVHTEVAGSVLIDETRKIYFKMDSIIADHRGIFSLDHKTGSRFSPQWANQWAQKIQMGCYTHVLYCMYEKPEDIFGMVVNGLFIHNPPKMKKDGTPYAGAKDTEFHRVPIRKTLLQMIDWLATVNYWYDRLDKDFELLSHTQEDSEIMYAFPKNTESCSHYFGCKYRDYCAAWLNPIRKCEEPPVGFIEDHWDPREKQETAKKVVEL